MDENIIKLIMLIIVGFIAYLILYPMYVHNDIAAEPILIIVYLIYKIFGPISFSSEEKSKKDKSKK